MKRMDKEVLYKNRYKLVRKLGEGGSSVVYMAVDKVTDQVVTIKMIKESAYQSDEVSAMSTDEAAVLERLDHPAIPGVVRVYDDAFVLEYVPGNSLEKYIRHKGFLKEKEAVALGKELLDILAYLHERKEPLVYRDLKPANIMVRPDGHVALIDFGAARYYTAGDQADTVNLGTNGFAAPEQYGSLGQTDPRTDIYCFGRTLLQITGGKCSPELMMIIDRCTKPDREDRFDNCRQIIAALEKYPRVARKRRFLHRARYIAAAAVLALIISFAITHYETVVSYAAYDAQIRVPAVKERLGYAGTRISEFFENEFEVKIK
jgi:serine/threonine-protein kinase